MKTKIHNQTCRRFGQCDYLINKNIIRIRKNLFTMLHLVGEFSPFIQLTTKNQSMKLTGFARLPICPGRYFSEVFHWKEIKGK